jgi:hypothetical protein
MAVMVYIYQAALLCEECGEKCREEITDEGKAPEDPEDEGSYDSDDFPKGPQEEGESDSPSHCDACQAFLESPLTDEGADYVLQECERTLRGERDAGDVLRQWVDHYEGPCGDSRVTLGALAESGLTIAECLKALADRDEEIKRLTAEVAERDARLRKLDGFVASL